MCNFKVELGISKYSQRCLGCSLWRTRRNVSYPCSQSDENKIECLCMHSVWWGMASQSVISRRKNPGTDTHIMTLKREKEKLWQVEFTLVVWFTRRSDATNRNLTDSSCNNTEEVVMIFDIELNDSLFIIYRRILMLHRTCAVFVSVPKKCPKNCRTLTIRWEWRIV